MQLKFLAGKCNVKLPLHIYGQSTSYSMIRVSSGAVKKLMFLEFHSQYMVKTKDYLRGAYNDWGDADGDTAIFVFILGPNIKEP